jgi:hypothetical protein
MAIFIEITSQNRRIYAFDILSVGTIITILNFLLELLSVQNFEALTKCASIKNPVTLKTQEAVNYVYKNDGFASSS